MDTAVANALVSAGAGLLGAVIGAGATFATARKQYERDREAARADRADARVRHAAEECDSGFAKLGLDVGVYHHEVRHETEADTKARESRIQDTARSIRNAAVDLPAPLRTRVEQGIRFMTNAQDLSWKGFWAVHYDSTPRIAGEVATAMHELLSAFLRDETLPPPPDRLVEYEAALEDLDTEREQEAMPEIAHDEDRRGKWLRAHPDVARQLGLDPGSTSDSNE